MSSLTARSRSSPGRPQASAWASPSISPRSAPTWSCTASKEDGARAVAARRGGGPRGGRECRRLRTWPPAAGWIAQTVERFGGIDVLVNNAASARAATSRTSPVERWDAIMHVNLRAPFLLLQEAVALDEDARRRLDRQHRIGQRLHRRAEARAVLGVEGRADDADPQRGGDAEPLPDPRQSDQRRAGRSPKGAARQAARGQRRRMARRGGRDAAVRAPAVAARHRDRGRVLRLRRQRARHRHGMDLEQYPVGAPPNW